MPGEHGKNLQRRCLRGSERKENKQLDTESVDNIDASTMSMKKTGHSKYIGIIEA